jgi:hypothetical protein
MNKHKNKLFSSALADDENFQKILFNKFGFTEDGGIDVENQLKLFNILDWIKDNGYDNTEKPDVKYLNIPNICFSLTDKDDKREKDFSLQRIKRGFDDSETWSLRDTIANFIIPRLERYEEIAKDFLNRKPELIEDIELFLQAMKLVAKDNGSCIFTEKEENIVNKGLNNFPKIFMSLWW